MTPSSLYRRALCPGSELAEQGLPDTPSQDSEKGSLLHALDTKQPIHWGALPEEDRKLLEYNRELREQFILTVHNLHPAPASEPQTFIEQTFWFHSPCVIFPGTPDLVKYWPDRKLLLVADSKFGFIDVPNAESNLQLRAYLVMIAEEFKAADHFYGIITQPRSSLNPAHGVYYVATDLARARRQIEDIWRKCNDPKAPRHASLAACQYCKARATCPEAHKLTTALTGRDQSQQLTPAQRASRIPLLKLGIRLAKSELEHYKTMLAQDQAAVENYCLKPGALIRSVTDVCAAFTKLREAGLIDAEGFIRCCDLSILQLQRQVAQHCSLSEMEAAEAIYVALGDTLNLKSQAPQLYPIANA